ncbi:MAG: type II secretion system protein GspH [Myxococcales bacterium FL481]|nr:MAG: type II secretion system protein GspH [Myxococcales bacterium FL481]
MSVGRARRRPRGRSRGMTLIEILVVMGLLALVAQVLLVGFGSSGQAEIHRATNEIAGTLRFAFDRARVTGRHFRLHIDFEKRAFSLQSADERMYLPATDRDGKLTEIDEDEIAEREERDQRAAEAFNRSVQADVFAEDDAFNPYRVGPKMVPRQRPPLFKSFERENTLKGLGDAVVLPDEVRIVSVRTDSDFAPVVAGETAIYFFPQGRTQLAHIQLSDEAGDNVYTIKVQPLTGKVTVVDELEPLVLPEDSLDAEDDQGKKQDRRSR